MWCNGRTFIFHMLYFMSFWCFIFIHLSLMKPWTVEAPGDPWRLLWPLVFRCDEDTCWSRQQGKWTKSSNNSSNNISNNSKSMVHYPLLLAGGALALEKKVCACVCVCLWARAFVPWYSDLQLLNNCGALWRLTHLFHWCAQAPAHRLAGGRSLPTKIPD